MNTLEHEHTINGVPGRMFRRVPRDLTRGTWASQTWGTSRAIEHGRFMSVELRFDDNCGNGHNSFAATGEIRNPAIRGRCKMESGGCLHDEIAHYFPGLAHLIRWHLCATDGPMHYIANTLHLAGDRDCWGLRAGESRQIRDGKTGALSWRRAFVNAEGAEVSLTHETQYPEAPTRPAAPGIHVAYLPRLKIGEGKTRELDAARSAAIWPDATDAELCASPDVLRAALEARLPALLATFRADIESCGFAWSSAP